MVRLDRALVDRGLVRSRQQAVELIAAGLVRVNDVVAVRAAAPVEAADRLSAQTDHYVSRAAHKLLGALEDLGLVVAGRALDAGASTGGFTQVLLERGCSEVVAIDVGTDQLAPLLRSDVRVTSHEQTNLRDLELSHLGGKLVDLVVADVSFISLTLLVGPLSGVLRPDGAMLLMIKPQFEVGRERLSKGGVVRSPELHRAAIAAVTDAARGCGWFAQQVVPSRLPGPAGNQEFFAVFGTVPPAQAPHLDLR
jgi:23S rRNA (cytidine1920-2'-O)/16S rRNA (cytidine1409-2'-O)-methyltransferase